MMMNDHTVGEAILRHRESRRIAVVCGETRTTYQELCQDAEKLAVSLMREGVQKGDRIALDVGRTTDHVRLMLAAALCGAIGVTLEPVMAERQREHILADCEPVLTVTPELMRRMREPGETGPYGFPEISASDPYWLLYTSGSTGTPKGTVLCHGMALRACDASSESLRSHYLNVHCEVILCDQNMSYMLGTCLVLESLINGKTLLLATEKELESLSLLGQCIMRNHADYMAHPPTWVVKALDNPVFAEAIRELKVLVLAGEPVTEEAVRTVHQHAPGLPVMLSYGNSELFGTVADHFWRPGEADLLGTPTKFVAVYLLDENSAPVRPGMRGEICIGGKAASLGFYWRAAELTERKYEEHPAFGRIYHTGDEGRLDEDGTIRITGRLDGMVKLHGVRIEPEYPERVLRGFPGIGQAAVVAVKRGSDRELCAFYTCSGASGVDEMALRRYLADALPYYMIPVRFVRLDSLPLNAGGKLDRRQLSEHPAVSEPSLSSRGTASDREIMRTICKVFQSVLHLTEQVRPGDSFFDLGGNSIEALEAAYLMEQEGYPLQMKWLYAAPSPELLAGYVERNAEEGQGPERGEGVNGNSENHLPDELRLKAQDILEMPVEAVYPVTGLVRRTLNAGRAWMLCLPYSVEKGLSAEEWKARIREAADHREILRSVFLRLDGQCFRAVLRKYEPDSFYVDLSRQEEPGKYLSDGQRRYMNSLMRLLFADKKEPLHSVLFRAGCIRITKDRSILLFHVSHMLLDDTGTSNLVCDLVSGEPFHSDAPLFQKRLGRLLYGDRRQAEAYWDSLRGAEWMPAIPPKPGRKLPAMRLSDSAAKTGLGDRAAEFCKAQGIPFSVCVHTLVGRALGRLTGTETVDLLTFCSGRSGEEIRLTGMLAMPIPFRYRMRDSWMDVQEQLISSQTHAWLMEDSEWCGSVETVFADGVLLDIRDSYHHQQPGSYAMVEPTELMAAGDRNNLQRNVAPPAPLGKLRIYVDSAWPWLYILDFNTGDVDPGFIAAFKKELELELGRMSSEKERPRQSTRTVRELLVNAGGRRREDGFFVLSDGDCVKTVTHGQFLREVWALGTGMYMEKIRNQRVMIVGKNSYEWVLAAFSVMCGENTAVLADPGLNAEGLMKRAAEAGATVVIGDNGILSGLHGSFVKIPFSELRDKVREGESLLRQGNTDFEESAPDTEREAAVLFTTGTTGGVKAVALSHRNLCSSADSVYGYIEDHKRALIVLPLHHIAAFSTSLITSIRHGWEVAVVGDYRELIPMILKVRPGFMNLVPRLADVLLMWLSDEKNAEKSELSLREIGMGGTDISENYREEFRKYGIGLKAAYGLTETSGAVMIDGLPIGGIEVKLAGGEQGELLFRGPEIFAGYLNDGKATSQVFEGGWFHTGDIGRREPDGTYAIVGRLKNLIILPNGENVSPEELENRLEESPLIRESMVYGDGEELAAVVVMASGADDAVEAAALVRKEVDRICRVLPAYMRISKVSTQKEPLLRNGLGKLIRAAKP